MAEETAKKKGPLYWIFRIIVFLLILLVAMYGVGFFLPEEFQGEATATVDNSPEEVWKLVSNVKKYPVAGEMAVSVEELPQDNGMDVWKEDLGSSVATIKILESKRPNYQKREIKDSVVPMTAVMEIKIKEEDGKTKLTAINTITIKNGTWHVPIFRWIMMAGGAGQGMKQYLTSISKGLEK